MNMKRIDIKQHDVFISWTGTDRELKDQVVDYLRKNDISCLESDHQCSGDFRQWSKEAVGVCNIFLPIVSSATFQSKFVPVEIEEYKELDNYKNRIVPVWTSKEVFDTEPWNIKDYGSSVILDKNGLTETALKDILDKVVSLIINLLDTKYKQASKSEYIKLISLSRKSKNISRDFDFSKLYINRTLCETDEQGQKQNEYKTTEFLYDSNCVSFIYGPAGCGKSQYINQIRENAPEDVVIINLPCSKTISSPDVFSAAYKEFSRVCGNRYFYTESDFVSLINNRRIMLVFDGMDEIATVEGKRKLISQAEEFCNSNRGNTILVFTGRNVSDADLIAIDGKNVRRFLLEKLREDEIRTLSKNLFVCFKRESEFDAFFVKISDLNEEIRSNPLLLSQLAIIYYDKKYVPESVVGIYDAISEITLKLDKHTDIVVPDEYKEMVSKEISGILKDFSKERYLLLSKGKNIEPCKIFSRILKSRKYDDIQSRSEFLVDYLESRAIFVDGEFYHKMFLEYFTAVKYYESAFDDYDEIEDVATVEELFSHYADSYWSAVIKMFLVKADSLVDENTMKSLYELITDFGVCEYTILFDTCRDLLRFKKYAQNALVSDIIKKSAEGLYPAYGSLFWYVPEYGLYESCLVVLESLQQEPEFAKMLALVRDVCFIMGGKYTAESFTDKVSPAKLFAAAQENLSGVRKALCELFYLGATDFSGGEDVYPRCFNVSEAKSFMKNGCGVIGRMSTPFSDELGLFSHTAYNELNDEFIGIVSCPYVIDEIESRLSKKSCRKLTGLILSSSENTTMEYIAINRRHIRVVYVPENLKVLDYSYDDNSWNINMSLSLGVTVFNEELLYFSSKFYLPDSIKAIPSYTFYDNPVLENIYIPSTVNAIGEYAFKGCRVLTTVNIPKGITKIYEGTFRDCRSLAYIDIPYGVKEIDDGALSYCYSLESINIPDSVTRIGESAFFECVSMKMIDIPDSVTEIGCRAFANCKEIMSIRIPENIQKIEFCTFSDCSSLTMVNIPESVTEIGCRAFTNCNALTSIYIPDNVTKIGSSAFASCSSLTLVNIPDSVKIIDSCTFWGCTSLTSIHIPYNVTKINERAFWLCRSLSSINIPEGVTEIENEAFGLCGSLESISIPNSVNRIGKGAFCGCLLLKSINIPDNVTEIGSNAFGVCEGLLSVEISIRFKDDVERIFENINTDIIRFRPLPDTFSVNYCKEENVIIPYGTTEINPEEFINNENIKFISIPETVIKIGNKSFYGCSSLTSIIVPNSVTEIGWGAFGQCISLKSIKLSNDITEIEDSLFEFCFSLTSIDIPDVITKIGENAFRHCRGLISIDIPYGVTEIGSNAFEYCSSLISVSIPQSISEIGRFTFSDCISLASIIIPNSVTKIGWFAFYGCHSLTSIDLPNSIEEIGENAFFCCCALTSVNIPINVKEISRMTFAGCESLTSINIHNNVTEIKKGAFVDCRSLTSIEIPSSVRIIGDDAFKGCTNLTSITINRRFEDDISRIFGDINHNIITFID